MWGTTQRLSEIITQSISKVTDSLTSDNGMDTASYDFQGIGNYGPNDTYESKGVAIFDEVATGKLSSLANSVAIYKVKVDANDNGAFLMWHWK